MAGRIVNKRELAEIVDVNEQTLSEWQRSGMPMKVGISKRVGNQYDTAAVIAWMVAREVASTGTESTRDRLARLQGDQIEANLAIQRRELIPASEIEPEWSSMVVAARQALLSLPGRVTPMLEQLEHADAMRELLREEIEAALRKLGTEDESSFGGAAAASAREMGATASD